MTAPTPEKKESKSDKSLSSKTVEQLFMETVDAMEETGMTPKEQAALTELKRGYDEKKLKLTLDTLSEVDGMKAEIDEFLTDKILTPGEKMKLDSNIADDLARETVEEAINGQVSDVEKISDLRALSLDQLRDLESKHEGILFYAFTDFVSSDTKVDFANYKSWYKAPKDGDEFKINFHGNQEAYWKLGAGDILPPTVRGVTVYVGGDKSNVRASERRVGLKGGGFFNEQGYIPVFTSDVVRVGAIQMDFDQKYRKADGGLDFDKYDAEVGVSDREYVDEKRAEGVPVSKYHSGDSLSDSDKEGMGLDKKVKGRKIDDIIRNQPDLYYYAHSAREKYSAQTGIDVPESIMFSIMKHESGFRVDVLNKQGSGAGGLFQFIPSTWNEFLKDNPWVYQKMAESPKWKNKDQMEWRFNPEIMIYAGYWLATKSLKYVYAKKEQITYSKFAESGFAKTGKIEANEAWILYLTHHDGYDGAVRRFKYLGCKEKGMSESEAARTAELTKFQMYNYTFKNGKTVYDTSKIVADKKAKWIMGICKDTMKTAVKYDEDLKGVEVPEEGTGWGW